MGKKKFVKFVKRVKIIDAFNAPAPELGHLTFHTVNGDEHDPGQQLTVCCSL